MLLHMTMTMMIVVATLTAARFYSKASAEDKADSILSLVSIVIGIMAVSVMWTLIGSAALLFSIPFAAIHAAAFHWGLRVHKAVRVIALVASIAMMEGLWLSMETFTADYAGDAVVVGSREDMTPFGKEYLGKNSYKTDSELTLDAAGSLESIWNKSSMTRRKAVIHWLFHGCLAALAMAGFRPRRRAASLPDGQNEDSPATRAVV